MSFDFQIIGAGRGGTSLLTGLIDAHPDCTVDSETISTLSLMGRQWSEAETFRSAAERIPARIRNYINACEAASAASTKKYWGHKTTTEHIMNLSLIHRDSPFADDPEAGKAGLDFDRAQCFAEATRHISTIFILRDGRTCVRSKMARKVLTLEIAIMAWKFSVKVLSAYQNAAAKLHVVKLEDLVTEPEQSLRGVCDFLGVTFTSSMFRGTRSEKIRAEYRRDGFDRSVIEHDNPAWASAIHDELVTLGYAR